MNSKDWPTQQPVPEPWADGGMWNGPVDEEQEAAARARRQFPRLDWHELWADDTAEEWIHEPLLPARRSVVIYSRPKAGKSLLVLEFAVALSLGGEFLGDKIERRHRVLYVDFENDPRGDVRSRLQSMGYGPDDLDYVDYLSFPTMAGLDTERGSCELLEAVKAYGSEVVVIDTVSRAVSGEENSNDTWLGLYRHTGLKLKQAGVAVVRLDHSGKDETKGQRGGSAKSGDVDVAWRMSKVADNRLRLECEINRCHIPTKSLELVREQTPRLRHRLESLGQVTSREQKILHIIDLADSDGLPSDASRDAVAELARDRGIGGRTDLFAEVVKRRKLSPTLGDSAPGQHPEMSVPMLGGGGDSEAEDPLDTGEKSCPRPSGTTGDSAPRPSLSPGQQPLAAPKGTAGQDSPSCPDCGGPNEPLRASLGYPCLACVVAS